MFKQRIIRVIGSLILLATVTGSSGITADSLGLTATSLAPVCSTGSSTGGGC